MDGAVFTMRDKGGSEASCTSLGDDNQAVNIGQDVIICISNVW